MADLNSKLRRCPRDVVEAGGGGVESRKMILSIIRQANENTTTICVGIIIVSPYLQKTSIARNCILFQWTNLKQWQ
jgi:hypothetical protein